MASKTARIVLVEDNPGDVLLVRRALQEKGIAAELTCFEDGQKALESLAQRDAPDLLLLDLNLPKIEGFELLTKIRSTPKLSAVPVVILTSSESPGDMQRTALLGAACYITKPSGLGDFLREVGCVVEEMLLASGWK
jgi:chemotaxis family two-component system response regulator Rcp1